MTFDATTILQTITLATVAWTLREVIRIGRKIERHDQKLSDLPCDSCPAPKQKKQPLYEYP